MGRVAHLAYAPYLPRMGGLRPVPMDIDYALAVADSEAWVAESGADLVGFLILVAEDDGLLLEGVAVLPSHQGQGIGRALLDLAEERAVAGGHARIRLCTHETMVENQRLYERSGYVETHRATKRGRTRVFYEKPLTRAAPRGARPHDPSGAGCLIVVSGPPGSGKTTESKRLERERRGVRFCPDEWMAAFGVTLWDGDVRARIESLQWQVATQVLRGGGTAIIEWGTWGRDERDRLRTEAQELGARVELLHLDVPLEELWRRVQQRGAEDPPMQRSDLAQMCAFVRSQRPDEDERSRYDAVLSVAEGPGGGQQVG